MNGRSRLEAVAKGGAGAEVEKVGRRWSESACVFWFTL